MDDTRAAEIRTRLNAATPGPWELIGFGEYIAPVGILVAPDDGGVSDADADLIAHAPTDLADLLDEREQLLAVVEAASDLEALGTRSNSYAAINAGTRMETAVRAYRAATTREVGQ